MSYESKFYSQHKSLTFDDVLILPTEISYVKSRLDVDSTSFLTKNWKLRVPIIASPMDRVSNVEVARVMATYGGAACFHRFQSVENQVQEIRDYQNLCGPISKITPTIAAVSAQLEDQNEAERIEKLSELCDIFIIDTAMGTNIKVLRAIEHIKKKYPQIDIIAGNVVTPEGCMTLINAGADAIRAGIGNGKVCLTRIQTGVGRGTVSVLIESSDICRKHNVSLICDGGISTPGDFAKSIAAGANMTIMGSTLAAHSESPGEVFYRWHDHYFPGNYTIYVEGVGNRLAKDIEGLEQFKQYRGMASRELQEDWHGGIKKGTTHEGMQKYLKVKGSLVYTLDNFLGGLRSSMTYCNASTIEEFQQNTKFEKLSPGTQIESYTR
jgi:IMP dehydrogenase